MHHSTRGVARGAIGVSTMAENVVVVGTGLLGASLAAAGRRAGAFGHTTGVGRGRANLETALARGLVDEISTDLESAVARADLVVLATPVDSSLLLLPRVVEAAPEDCTLTDIGSVKGPICERAEALGVGDRFVGSHPLAGGTASGAAAADPDLFQGRVTVVAGSSSATPRTRALVRGLWESVGSRVVELEPAHHDRALALTSHLPQMLAFALAALADRDSSEDAAFIDVCGSGLRDTTRLGDSDPDLWAAVADLNRQRIVEAMGRFSELWAELGEAVAAGDGVRLRALVAEAHSLRSKLRA